MGFISTLIPNTILSIGLVFPSGRPITPAPDVENNNSTLVLTSIKAYQAV